MDPASAFSFVSSYCGFPPTPDTLWGRWNFDPLLLAALGIIAAYGGWSLRRAPAGRKWAFAAAWMLSVILFVSPVCALTVALFSARVSHHMVLLVVVAPLLALALPARRGRGGLLPPLAISTAALWLWHLPSLYALSFAHPAIYWVMQLSLLGSSTWLWLGVWNAPSGFNAGLAALASAMQMGFLGALLVFAGDALYWPHFGQTLAFGLSPRDDQQLAGLIMWVPANLPLLAAVLWRLGSLLRTEGVPAR